MKYVFYADIFMLINFLMDFFLLKVTGRLLKKHTKTTSYLLGALVGAAGVTIHVMSPWKGTVAGRISAYLILSFIMCAITFSEKRIREALKIWGIFYLVSFMLGGIMNAVYFYNSNLMAFLALAVLSYLLLNFGAELLKVVMGRTGQGDDILNVELRHHGKSICVKALFDSGNSLLEPIRDRKSVV